jgi:IS30 family transposase
MRTVDLSKIREMKKRGMSLRDIAQELGTSAATILRRLKVTP